MANGPCAKQAVKATVVMLDGSRYTGANECRKPQTRCPRDAYGYKTGEGYHLCAEVCDQVGHAEAVAVWKLVESHQGRNVPAGGVCYLEGHTYACGLCTRLLDRYGIRLQISAPPAAAP